MKKIDESLGMVIKNYYLNQHLSATKIGKLVNLQTITVCRYLKREGIEVINYATISKIDEALGKKIVELYKSGRSLSKISKEIDVSIGVISKYLKSIDIEVINYHNLPKFNETVFDNINSEEVAYWLGFIFADGYISSRDNGFELSLGIKDLEHLKKFNKFMGFNGDNVKISVIHQGDKSFTRCRWGIVNKHLWNTLNDYGCTPKKSKTLKFPTKIPIEYLKDFIRGYFDGDGCITYIRNGDKVNTTRSTVLGTNSFLGEVKKILEENGIKSKIITDKRMKDTVILEILTKSEKDFLMYLYNESTIYLDRKFNRFKFFSICRSDKELAEFLASEIGESWNANPEVTEESNESSEP